MVGIAVAEMMLHFEIDTLRTMPEPDHYVIWRSRRQARALEAASPAETLEAELLCSLDHTSSKHLALMHQSRWLFRDAGTGTSTVLTCSSVSRSVEMLRSRTGCVGGCLSWPRS